MKSYNIVESSNGNDYLVIDSKVKRIEFLHPVLKYILECYENNKDFKTIKKEISKKFKYSNEVVVGQLNKFNNYVKLGYLEDINREYLNEKNTTSDLFEESIINSKDIAFEVTEKCNLKCKYCAYSDVYDFYSERHGINMDVKIAKNTLDFIYENINLNFFIKKIKKTINFYGGEPLLRIDFISEIFEYCKKFENVFEITFAMTTNGLLIHKYMEFLVENNFILTISIDGNKEANSYRVYHNGKESFNDLVKNIYLLKNKYPDYFNKNVVLNSVFHNNNNVIDSIEFLRKEFDKDTKFSDINPDGVSEKSKEKFNNIFKSYEQEYYFTSCKEISFISLKQYKSYNPYNNFISTFLPPYNNSIFSYMDLYRSLFQCRINSATCLPGHKIFITAQGKILPCEKVAHCYSVGDVDINGVHINFKKEAIIYEKYLKKFKEQCKQCYRFIECPVCMYSLNLNSEKVVCDLFLNRNKHIKYMINVVDYFEQN